MYQLARFSRGKAKSRAPIIKGIRKFPRTAGIDRIKKKKIIVTPTTAITAVAPGNKDELKPGTQIIIMAADKQPDGSVLAKTLYVGRSLTPAM